MAWELEALIAHLLMLISCAGEHGCSVKELLQAINDSSAPSGSSSRNVQEDEPDRAASTIWKWLVERNDVSVGRGREYNHLALPDLLALPQFHSPANNGSHGTNDGDTKKSQSPSEEGATGATANQDDVVKVYTLEATMWEAITGHAPDYKRVPRSEWLLLLGIASSKANGILQGDLGRLVDQDKRSVPKRTDALVKKGYITKRTTLVRGTKTSKLWLKSFTPPLPKDNDSTARPGPEMNLSRQTLAENLDPVPWHTSWTGVDIDYAAIAATIMAITKEWEVIRMHDLKLKLGILGMRWQMKILAKACRFLNSRGAVQYVAAKLDNRLFKDCLRFNRDLNAEDWSIYLSTGKRSGKSARGDDMTTGEEDDEGGQPSAQQANKARLIASAPWTMDKPLPHSIAKMVQSFGDSGVSNPGIYSLTLGATFNRFLSAMTGSMSTPGIQPTHLQHLQLRSEHVRAGKVASYMFFTPQPPKPAAPNSQSDEHIIHTSERGPASAADALYGFAPATAVPPVTDTPVSLTDICGLGISQKKAAKKLERRGRPRKGAARPSDAIPSVELETDAVERLEPDALKQEPDLEQGPGLIVVLKVRPEALLSVTANDQSSPAAASQEISPRRWTRANRKSPEQAPQGGVAVEDGSEGDPEGDAVAPSATPTRGGRGRGRGRPRGRGAGRGRGGSGKPHTPRGTESSSVSRPWTCEKCGGSWKNDIGLKYHLEKSRTTCNRSYSAANLPTGRKRRPPAFFRPRNSSSSDKDDSKSPQGRASPSPNNTGAVDGRSPPSTDRHSQTEQPVSEEQRPVEEVKAASPRAVKSWKRPTTLLEEPEPAPFSPQQSNQGLLLLHEASLPRQLSAFTIHSRSGTPAASSLDKKSGRDLVGSTEQAGEANPDPEASQAENQGRPAQEETSGPSLVTGGVRASADAPNRKRRAKPDKATCERIWNMIEGMLKEKNGALLGGDTLWHAITTAWNTAFPDAPVPTEKDCQWAVNSLLKKKLVVEHWHAFRDQKGMFAKFQLITRPDLDAFSPESLRLIEKVKDERFQAMVPPEGEGSDHSPSPNKVMRFRGRRLLAKEVAVLDAPVYAAQVAAKRAADAADDGTRRTKRQKYSMKPMIHDTDDLSPSPRRRRGARVRFTTHRADDGYSDDDRVAALPTEGPAVAIRFLEPNTQLDDGPLHVHIDASHVHPDAASSPSDVESPPPEEEKIHHEISPAVAACRDTDVFMPVTPISGIHGAWPWFDPQQLDRLGTSFTLSGWIPDRRWFSWAAITDEIDKRYAAHGRRCSVPATRAHQRFINRLLACMDVERSWGTAFAYAMPGDAGPYNIFVSFLMEPGSHRSNPLPDLLWPPEEQLTPTSAKSAIAELDEDSSSSSMDDGLGPPPHVGTMMARATPRLAQLPNVTNTRQTKIKRVALVTRALTALPTPVEIKSEQPADIDNPDEVLAAFVAVRSLLGGADKAIDWGLMMKLFPKLELVHLRRFWTDARKERGAFVTGFTRVFQERLIGAYENDELPMIDFEKPLEYDWGTLIRWTMRLPSQEGFQMPRLRESLNKQYTLEDAKVATEDWREKYFHVLTSIFTRFEAVTSEPGVISIGGASAAVGEKPMINDMTVAKSWIKSLCATEETRYSVEQIKNKFLELCPNNKHQRSALFRDALAQLTQQRVICRSKRPFIGGRPYRLNEWYVSALAKMAQVPKYDEAAAFKAQLDSVFRNHEAMRVPYTFSDGAMMALTNLQAAGRIQLVPVDVPNIPFGFEPGNYESRKYPKSYYYFGLEVVPTAAYEYNEEIDVLRSVATDGAPSGGPRGELPQWFDLFGERNAQRWSEILGAFCFAFATRGSMTVDGICSALSPVLDEFEAHLIVDWGKRTGVLTDLVDGMGITVGEWWWLAVPWLRRATVAAGSGAGSSGGKRP